MKRTTLAFLLAAAALAAASIAAAATVTATGTVAGAGSVTIASGATATFATTLDGTDQTVNYTVPLTVVDARGTGGGWNLTITSTTFTTGTKTLATAASSLPSVTTSCVVSVTCTNPTNGTTYPITVPAAGTAPTAVKFFSSASATGLGSFTITPTIAVSIPGNTYAGSYSSTLTVAAVAGP
ncbi:MAG: WxL domain-containing protein [Actinomycetes bacterium]